MDKVFENDAPVNVCKTTGQGEAPPGGGGKRKHLGPGEHIMGEDVNLSHNRQGRPLCGGFQTGQCTEKDRWSNCLNDGQSKHQCAKCLSEDHGSNVCPQSGPKAPRVFKGKGAGGRGGKKGGKSKKN